MPSHGAGLVLGALGADQTTSELAYSGCASNVLCDLLGFRFRGRGIILWHPGVQDEISEPMKGKLKY
jgi:hypothetical protein